MNKCTVYVNWYWLLYYYNIYVYKEDTPLWQVTTHTPFTSIQFVARWRKPKCMAAPDSSTVVHIKYKHWAASFQWHLCMSDCCTESDQRQTYCDRHTDLRTAVCGVTAVNWMRKGLTLTVAVQREVTLFDNYKNWHLFLSKIYLTKLQSCFVHWN
jgi:hypothetical protein